MGSRTTQQRWGVYRQRRTRPRRSRFGRRTQRILRIHRARRSSWDRMMVRSRSLGGRGVASFRAGDCRGDPPSRHRAARSETAQSLRLRRQFQSDVSGIKAGEPGHWAVCISVGFLGFKNQGPIILMKTTARSFLVVRQMPPDRRRASPGGFSRRLAWRGRRPALKRGYGAVCVLSPVFQYSNLA